MEATKQTEIRILSTIRVKENWFKYKSILQPAFFASEETKQLFQIIEGFFQKYDSYKLSTGNMRLLINKNIKDEDLRESCLSIVSLIRRQNSTDNKIIQETISHFAKIQLVKLAITEALALLDHSNPDFLTVKEYIDKAMNLDVGVASDTYSYFEDPGQRMIDEVKEKKISTGIKRLDLELDGGMSPGELLVFLGPPGRGKTTALINMGMGALMQGLKVLHLTLEISDRKIARRYDMRITKNTFQSLRDNPGAIKNPLSRLKAKGCNLVIKDYSMESPRVQDIYSMVLNYQSRNNEQFDIIVVDYGDLLAPGQKHKDTRHSLEEVYTDLRRLAVKLQVPIYTASQSNRESLNRNLVGLRDVAESFGKVKVADVVIGICQTPEEEEEKLVRLFIAKSRKKSGHPTIRLALEPETMFMGEYKSGKN